MVGTVWNGIEMAFSFVVISSVGICEIRYLFLDGKVNKLTRCQKQLDGVMSKLGGHVLQSTPKELNIVWEEMYCVKRKRLIASLCKEKKSFDEINVMVEIGDLFHLKLKCQTLGIHCKIRRNGDNFNFVVILSCFVVFSPPKCVIYQTDAENAIIGKRKFCIENKRDKTTSTTKRGIVHIFFILLFSSLLLYSFTKRK